MEELNPTPEKKPWWNDQDKMGGLIATIILLGAAVFLTCVIAGLGIWILDHLAW
jgi:hypothetical protein